MAADQCGAVYRDEPHCSPSSGLGHSSQNSGLEDAHLEDALLPACPCPEGVMLTWQGQSVEGFSMAGVMAGWAARPYPLGPSNS